MKDPAHRWVLSRCHRRFPIAKAEEPPAVVFFEPAHDLSAPVTADQVEIGAVVDAHACPGAPAGLKVRHAARLVSG